MTSDRRNGGKLPALRYEPRPINAVPIDGLPRLPWDEWCEDEMWLVIGEGLDDRPKPGDAPVDAT